MTQNIDVKHVSRFIAVAASVLTVGAAISFFNGNGKGKALALNIGLLTTGITAGCVAGSKLTSDAASYQGQTLANNFKREISQLDKQREELASKLNSSNEKINQQTNALNEANALNNQLTEQIKIRDGLVIKLRQDIETLKTKFSDDDKRLSIFKYELKSAFQESLIMYVDSQYEKLGSLVDSKLADERYVNIHPQLENYLERLKTSHDNHYQQINNVAYVEDVSNKLVDELTSTYYRVFDEIGSLRVRFRNIINLEERLTLDSALEELIERRDPKKFASRDKVQSGLNLYRDEHNEDYRRLEELLEDDRNGLKDLREQVSDLINQIDIKNLEIADLKQRLQEANKPQLFYGVSIPTKAGNSISNYFYKNYEYKLDCLTWAENATGYELTFGIRHNPGLSESDLFADNSKEKLAGLTNSYPGAYPKLEFNRQVNTIKLTVTLRPAVKKVVTPEEFTQNLRDELQPPSALINFVKDAYHVGLWAETGSGKTTAISNIIGGMIQVLGGSPEIRLTIPKIDEETQKIFPRVDWLGVPKSVFGLLEAALEIQYRIWKNEQAYLAKEKIEAFSPILFFIDEINLIFTRWGKVNEADINDALDKFSESLNGERLEYFNNYMRTELLNYKNEFAKRLLLFIWQTGRSLNVKSLVSGQNLQPGAFRMMKADLANCAYLALGDSIDTCKEYKVKSIYMDDINAQKEKLDEAVVTDPLLKFTGLYCPSQGKPYFGMMPEPNYYKWGDVHTRPLNSNASSQEINFVEARKQKQQGIDATPDNMDGIVDITENNRTVCQEASRLKAIDIKDCPVYDSLPNKLKTLDYGGMVKIYAKLPKKADGSVYKMQAYQKVFKVKRSDDRKIMSQLIDFLESEFKL
ncbi:MAG: hypothetical protein HC874_24945 [Richelia sp. SL_2_1]|nr:hypothetical protein [Richelia sp. SM1_7_0]NJO30423.1 hypothetical protein [Richelia sp. SL_2_1]